MIDGSVKHSVGKGAYRRRQFWPLEHHMLYHPLEGKIESLIIWAFAMLEVWKGHTFTFMKLSQCQSPKYGSVTCYPCTPLTLIGLKLHSPSPSTTILTGLLCHLQVKCVQHARRCNKSPFFRLVAPKYSATQQARFNLTGYQKITN